MPLLGCGSIGFRCVLSASRDALDRLGYGACVTTSWAQLCYAALRHPVLCYVF